MTPVQPGVSFSRLKAKRNPKRSISEQKCGSSLISLKPSIDPISEKIGTNKSRAKWTKP